MDELVTFDAKSVSLCHSDVTFAGQGNEKIGFCPMEAWRRVLAGSRRKGRALMNDLAIV
jgi:hypothetical protein